MRSAFRGVKRTRTCRTDGCDQKVGPGAAYCRAHTRSPEAVAFRRELQSAGAYLELAAESLDPDQVERIEAFHRFRQRAKHGRFDRLLEAPTRRMLEQAAAVEGFELELGALRYGLMRVLTEETDPTRLALSLARLSNAVVRATGEASRLGVDADARREDDDDAFFGRAAMVMGRAIRGTDQRKALGVVRAGGPLPNDSPRWELARRMMAVEDAWLAEQADAAGGMGAAGGTGAAGGASEWDEEEERMDEAVAARIAKERSAAVRRWEAERGLPAVGSARGEPAPEPRVTRGGR